LRYVEVPCDVTTAYDPIEVAGTSGQTELRYDTAAEHYIFKWKTAKSFEDKCYQLVLELDNGTTPFALFKFTK
jgi:hypothetical protein